MRCRALHPAGSLENSFGFQRISEVGVLSEKSKECWAEEAPKSQQMAAVKAVSGPQLDLI